MNTFILFFALWHPPAWILHAANVAATIADVETTQHCLHAGTCSEGNPLMPSNRVGAYAVGFGLVGVETAIAEHERKRGRRGWWFGPVVGGSVHAGAAIANHVRFGK